MQPEQNQQNGPGNQHYRSNKSLRNGSTVYQS